MCESEDSMGLRPLACWDCGFKYLRGHGCLSLVNVVGCQVEVSATGRNGTKSHTLFTSALHKGER